MNSIHRSALVYLVNYIASLMCMCEYVKNNYYEFTILISLKIYQNEYQRFQIKRHPYVIKAQTVFALNSEYDKV